MKKAPVKTIYPKPGRRIEFIRHEHGQDVTYQGEVLSRHDYLGRGKPDDAKRYYKVRISENGKIVRVETRNMLRYIDIDRPDPVSLEKRVRIAQTDKSLILYFRDGTRLEVSALGHVPLIYKKTEKKSLEIDD